MQDISRTRLRIQVYSLDYDQYMGFENLPPFFYERMFVGNNTEFHENRQNLKFPHILMAMDDVMDFLLFQQNHMSRPVATYIPEPFYTTPLSIVLPHRSPFLVDFNRYISHIKDSGLLAKFRSESKFDGILGSVIRFFPNEEENRSLSLSYLQYAFIMWFVGLCVAILVFIAGVTE